jgi:hypothetical protein
VHPRSIIVVSLLLCASVCIGCSSKKPEDSSDASTPSSKSASFFGPKEVTLPAGTAITVALKWSPALLVFDPTVVASRHGCDVSRVRRQGSASQGGRGARQST